MLNASPNHPRETTKRRMAYVMHIDHMSGHFIFIHVIWSRVYSLPLTCSTNLSNLNTYLLIVFKPTESETKLGNLEPFADHVPPKRHAMQCQIIKQIFQNLAQCV